MAFEGCFGRLVARLCERTSCVRKSGRELTIKLLTTGPLNMGVTFIVGTLIGFSLQVASAVDQPGTTKGPVLQRRYRDGERLHYQMSGQNEAWQYRVQADGIVRRDSRGRYFEEYTWSNLTSGGNAVPLTAESASFRQELSLDPERTPAIPDLSKVSPMLIGPITDMLTFYSDLWLAIREGNFNKPGDHLYFCHGPNSWADGNSVVLGEDAIDFNLKLKDISQSDGTATVVIQHVPPAALAVKLPAAWMSAPVGGTPNNWVEVTKDNEGKYVAEVGKETFDVLLTVSLADGRILSATLDNLVLARKCECVDAALTRCGDPVPVQIKRKIEIQLQD
jgi:hypothetical protein